MVVNLVRVIFQYLLQFMISSRDVQVGFELEQHHKLVLDVLLLRYFVFDEGKDEFEGGRVDLLVFHGKVAADK